MDKLNFRILKDHNLFNQFKQNFLLRDQEIKTHSQYPGFEIDLDQDLINYEIETERLISSEGDFEFNHDIYSYSSKMVTESFESDYFPNKVDDFLSRLKLSIQNDLDKRNVFGIDAVKNYGERMLNRIDDQLEQINKMKHLNKMQIDVINEKFAEFEEFLSKGLIDAFSEPKKIPINFSKVEFVVLFKLLYQDEIISPTISEKQMFRILESSFRYYNGKEFLNLDKTKIYANQLFATIEKKPYAAIRKVKIKILECLR